MAMDLRERKKGFLLLFSKTKGLEIWGYLGKKNRFYKVLQLTLPTKVLTNKRTGL